MSTLFGFSLFSSTAADATEPDTPQPVPPERDRSISSQFFSLFGGESSASDEVIKEEEPLPVSESPVSKTLSDMAQKMSDMADEAIRSMTPDQNNAGGSPGGPNSGKPLAAKETSLNHQRDSSVGSKLSEIVEDRASPEDEPTSMRVENKFPSYIKTKPKKDIPLLAFSQGRESLIDLNRKVIGIAENAKTEKETVHDQFKVTDHTGMSMKNNPSVLKQPLQTVTEDKKVIATTVSELEDNKVLKNKIPEPEDNKMPEPVQTIIVEDVDAPKQESEGNIIKKKEAPKLLDIGIVPKKDKVVVAESVPEPRNHKDAARRYDSDDYLADNAGEGNNKNLTQTESDEDVFSGFHYEGFVDPTASSSQLMLDVDEMKGHSLCSIEGNEPQNLIDQLLELGFLTEEEKEKLQKVLAADENLQKTQYNHYIKKHKDLYNERKQFLASADPSLCPLCFIKFGWFTNSGDVCPIEACQLKVCNSCRVSVQESWMCLMCHKEKDLKAQAGYWFQQPANNKKRVKTGTDILKKSLDGEATYSKGKPPQSLLSLAVTDDDPNGTADVEDTRDDETEEEQYQEMEGEVLETRQCTQEVVAAAPAPSTVQTQEKHSAPPHDNHVVEVRENHVTPIADPKENHVEPPSRKSLINNHVAGSGVRHSKTRDNHVTESENHVTPVANHIAEQHIPVINHVPHSSPHVKESARAVSDHSTPSVAPASGSATKNLKAPHIRDIKGQSLSADSGFINDDHTKEDSGIVEVISEDDDDNSTQFQRYLMARSVAPDELAPQADSPPNTPPGGVRGLVGSEMGQESSRGHHSENHVRHDDGTTMSAGASSSNMSCESISPSPTMIKANTKDRQIFGELCIGLVFNQQVSTLDVHVNEARNLCGVDGNPPQCYVKTYLLPDRSKTAKRKTKTKKRSSDPVFNEIFQYKAPSVADLASSTLWMTVWDTRQLGHNMFLGEVRIQLDSISLEKATPMWWQLQHLEDSHFRGSILLSLMYCPSPDDRRKKKTCLKLKVGEARDLPLMDNGRTNPYVALYLIPKTDSKDHKYKLQMKKNTVNPKWNAEVNFMNLDSAVIEDNGIEIQLLHLGKVEKAKQCVLIGVVRLCQHKTSVNAALDGRGIEVLHWKEALSKPGVWVEKWHNLRSWE